MNEPDEDENDEDAEIGEDDDEGMSLPIYFFLSISSYGHTCAGARWKEEKLG